jgi:hypothetical protein
VPGAGTDALRTGGALWRMCREMADARGLGNLGGRGTLGRLALSGGGHLIVDVVAELLLL